MGSGWGDASSIGERTSNDGSPSSERLRHRHGDGSLRLAPDERELDPEQHQPGTMDPEEVSCRDDDA
jgi:hypothetical protein